MLITIQETHHEIRIPNVTWSITSYPFTYMYLRLSTGSQVTKEGPNSEVVPVDSRGMISD